MTAPEYVVTCLREATNAALPSQMRPGQPYSVRLANSLLSQGWTPPPPPPLTEEPTDLAARVIDVDEHEWVRPVTMAGTTWVCVTVDRQARSFVGLREDFGPLRLWEPTATTTEETSR